MIVQLRIDERLIHGQITTAWSRYLDVSRIVVASDKLAKDPLTTQTLLMSAPAGKKVAVKTIPDAIKLLSDPRVDTVRADHCRQSERRGRFGQSPADHGGQRRQLRQEKIRQQGQSDKGSQFRSGRSGLFQRTGPDRRACILTADSIQSD